MSADALSGSTTSKTTAGGIPGSMDATPIASVRFSTSQNSGDRPLLRLGGLNMNGVIWDRFSGGSCGVSMGIDGGRVRTNDWKVFEVGEWARNEVKGKTWQGRQCGSA